MTRASALTCLICMTIHGSCFLNTAAAQDVITQTQPLVLPDSTTDAVNTYSGLLGKRYFELQYLGGNFKNPDMKPTGFDITYNQPMPIAAAINPNLGVDLFFTLTDFTMDDDAYTFELQHTTVGFGASFWFDVGKVRPFAQLGINYWDIDLIRDSEPDVVYVDDGLELLARFGAEVSVNDYAATRVTLDANSMNFERAELRTDLYLWPHERFYFRSGIGISIGGEKEHVFNIGGGFAF